MKINTQLHVTAAPGVEKAVAAELGNEVPDGDLEQLLAEQGETDGSDDTEDDTESL